MRMREFTSVTSKLERQDFIDNIAQVHSLHFNRFYDSYLRLLYILVVTCDRKDLKLFLTSFISDKVIVQPQNSVIILSLSMKENKNTFLYYNFYTYILVIKWK